MKSIFMVLFIIGAIHTYSSPHFDDITKNEYFIKYSSSTTLLFENLKKNNSFELFNDYLKGNKSLLQSNDNFGFENSLSFINNLQAIKNSYSALLKLYPATVQNSENFILKLTEHNRTKLGPTTAQCWYGWMASLSACYFLNQGNVESDNYNNCITGVSVTSWLCFMLAD